MASDTASGTSRANGPDTAVTEAQRQAMFDAALQAMRRAHAPYSRFQVGAAVLDLQGRIHAGCNVENAAYPQGACAETGALSAMVLAGATQVQAVLVMGEGAGLVTPCGGCRQRIREFAEPQVPIMIADPDHVRATFTLEQLLPHSFGPDHLRSS